MSLTELILLQALGPSLQSKDKCAAFIFSKMDQLLLPETDKMKFDWKYNEMNKIQYETSN